MMEEQEIKDFLSRVSKDDLNKLRTVLRDYYRLTMEAYQALYNEYSMNGWMCSSEIQDMITALSLSSQDQYDNCDTVLDQMLQDPEALVHMQKAMSKFIKE